MPDSANPSADYTTRLNERRADAGRLKARELQIGNYRLLVFAVGLGILAAGFGWKVLSPYWMILPVVAFAGLVVAHGRTIHTRTGVERRVRHCERALARIEERWEGTGVSGETLFGADHLFAADLDLAGRGSLFELLCTARTAAGEHTLASWLTAPANASEIAARQLAVQDLSPRLDLREEIDLLGDEVRTTIHPHAITEWAEAVPVLTSTAAAIIAAALAGAFVLVFVAIQLDLVPTIACVPILLGELVVGLSLRKRVHAVIQAVDQPGRDLNILAGLLRRIEEEEFNAPYLKDLQQRVRVDGQPASQQIERLQRLVHLLEARRNEIFTIISPLLLWGTQLALAIERWRAASGSSVGTWITAVGEFEAVASLAAYHCEHPKDVFPTILASGPVFRATGLGHPLIHSAQCVRNDVRLDPECALLVVSGSNMSGKSTLLRSIGLNTVLALAGAPVRATRLDVSILAVGASIRVQDSVHEGVSRFYAEILRLRQIVELAEHRGPALFLLDEVLSGTNSHDRRIGGAAILRGLVERGSIGLVTTHDLALTDIANQLAPRAINVHFEDHLEAGKMHFDYQLRQGVVQKSNALELMRSVGLKV